ncbi:MAG: hypothetical protein ACYDH5_03855 [Acidimicrobiales bacterium]
MDGQRTASLQFQKGPGQGQPNEWLYVPVAANGSWSATFVIPAFVGGEAMTRGSMGADVTPGTWQFYVPSCGFQPARTVDFQVTSTAIPGSRFVGIAATPSGGGYWLAQAGGGVFTFGNAAFYGSLQSEHVTSSAPITGIAPTPDGRGYWLVAANGAVFSFGDARYYGSLPAKRLSPLGEIVGITPTSNGQGYWFVGADGGVFSFGNAPYYGNAQDGVPKVGLLSTPGAKGYIIPTAVGIAADRSGDAAPTSPSYVGRGPIPLRTLLSGAAMNPNGTAYREVGTDGGVFDFGGAAFYGSLPAMGIKPAAPIVGIARTANGNGYWLLGADGGVFSFGNARFYGSAVG